MILTICSLRLINQSFLEPPIYDQRLQATMTQQDKRWNKHWRLVQQTRASSIITAVHTTIRSGMASCDICWDLDPTKSLLVLKIYPAPRIKASADLGCQSCDVLRRALEGLYTQVSVVHRFAVPWLSNESCLISLDFPQPNRIEFSVSFEYSSRFSDFSDDSERGSQSSTDNHYDGGNVGVDEDIMDEGSDSQSSVRSASPPPEDGWKFYGELFSLPGGCPWRCSSSWLTG